jgi:hypothetical protein
MKSYQVFAPLFLKVEKVDYYTISFIVTPKLSEYSDKVSISLLLVVWFLKIL